MRLAYIVNVFPKISETFIAHEVAELLRRGVEVEIFSLRNPQETLRHEVISRTGLEKRVHYRVEEFAGLIKGFEPNLLHAHFATEPTAAAWEFSRHLQIPFTFTAHGYDIRRKPPADFRERALAAARVITVSQANANYLVDNFQVPKEHISIIPCGVDLNLFKPACARPCEDAPLVLCVARHVKVKNLTLLLEACSILVGRGVSFQCAMIGDGPLRQELEATRAKLGLETVVQMPGSASQEQVLRWLQQAAAAVLTSENEGMPVALMEAAACGVPAVAPAVGGIPELIADGVTGFLTPAGDPEALAAVLQRLLEDSALRKQMSAAALLRANRLFSLSAQVNSLLKTWSAILNAHE